jgi:hypothetical protein
MITAVLVLAAPLTTPLFACGDKFLMVGQTARFSQAYAAIYPGAILLYARTGTSAAATILDARFQASLTRAGHRVRVVTREEAVADALRTEQVDLVLTDVADADAISSRAAAAASRPLVLPLLVKPTKAQSEAVKARYSVELKASDRPAQYLAAIDSQMHARVKLRVAQKR